MRTITVPVALFLGFLILLIVSSRALAAGQLQADPTPAAEATPVAEPEWQPPINLSQSGAASEPQVIVTNSQLHVVWQDAAGGFYYARGTDGGWSGPTAIDVPFGLRSSAPESSEEITLFRPYLIADNSGRIHAFWINDDGAMFYSSVAANDFDDLEAWAPAQLLSEGVLTLVASLDTRGVLHLSYVHSMSAAGRPAGIYYGQLTGPEEEWSAPTLLYQSDYFRTLAADAAHVDMTVSEAGQVFVAWDHRPLEKVFLTRSDNGGRDWQPAQEVDGRRSTDSSNAVSPNRVLVSTQGSNVLVLWMAGHDGTNCAPYYQSSSDGGATWQPVETVSGLPGCLQEGQLLASEEGYVLLLATVLGQAYLLAWDGASWSIPQAQSELATFPNPQTARQVNLSCYRPAVARGQLFIIGCDSNGGDIWVTSRPSGAVEGWFPPPPVWQAPQQLLSGESEIGAPALVIDSGGRRHAFWNERTDTAIFHSVLDGGRWSRPVTIVELPSASLSEPSVSVSAGDRLHLTWSDGQAGQIYFSQADAASAFLVSDWSVPQSLPVSQSAAGWPNLVVDGSGRIYLAYTIAINEARGVYVIWSDDDGESWSEPVQAFDGAEAGWDVVGAPQLALTTANRLHLAWTRHSAPGGNGPLALFYAHSDDGGSSWSEVDTIAEAPVMWSDIVGTSDGTVHLVWQERQNGQVDLQHSVSQDDGDTWSWPTIVSRNEEPGVVGVVAGGGGRLNLLQGTASGLEHWLWDGARWSRNEGVQTTLAAWSGLAVAMSQDGTLAVIYAGQTEAEGGQQGQEALFFTSRTLDGELAGSQSPPAEVGGGSIRATPTAQATASTSGSLVETATVTTTVGTVPNVPTVESAGSSPGWPNGLVFEILPAVLIVLVVFAIRFYAVRTRN